MLPNLESAGDDDWLTVKDVAARLRVCTATVYKILNRGELPFVRVIASIRIRREDLDAWLRADSLDVASGEGAR